MVSADEGQVNVTTGGRRMRVARGFMGRFLRRGGPPMIMAHPAQMKQMWMAIHRDEGWIGPRGNPGMNRAFEQKMACVTHVMQLRSN